MLFKRILIAVDFSPNSLEAFRVAAELARVQSASLHLLHVVEARPAMPADSSIGLVQKANKAVEQLMASTPDLGGITFTTEVTSGRAFEAIVNHTREWRADLIVLGAKGTTSLEEIVLGGTAEQLMKEAPCSILIVRPVESS